MKFGLIRDITYSKVVYLKSRKWFFFFFCELFLLKNVFKLK